MHFETLKPLHGWRAFIGEVGVVVLGVLLALGAQQLAQEAQAQSDERAFRETIDHEIGLNLFVYDFRARQSQCTGMKIAELQDWLGRARTAAAMPAIYPRRPAIITPYRSAWDNRDADVFNHLPQRVRQKYAEFYDELADNWEVMQREGQDWTSLWGYGEPGTISLEDRRAIRTTLAKIALWNKVLESNFAVSRKIAEELNVKEAAPDNFPPTFLAQLRECRSVTAPPGK